MDVILIHDAAIDEYMAQILLTTMPAVNLLGVVIVNADGIDSAAMKTSGRCRASSETRTFRSASAGPVAGTPSPGRTASDYVKMGNIGVLSWMGHTAGHAE